MGVIEEAAVAWVKAREAVLTAPMDDPAYKAKRYALADAEEFLARMVRALIINPDNHKAP